MMTWFKALDIQGKIGTILIVIGLLGIVIGTAFHLIDALTASAEQKGVLTERAAAQGATLETVETANAAKTRYRSDPAVRDADCLLDATNPEDC